MNGRALARRWNADLKKLTSQTTTYGPNLDPNVFLRDWRTQIYDPTTDADAKDLALMKGRMGVQAWLLPYEVVDYAPPHGTYRFRRTNERPNLVNVEMTRMGLNTRDLTYTAILDGGGWFLLICGRGADRSPTTEELLEGADEIMLTFWYAGGRSGEGPETGGPDAYLTLGSIRYPLYGVEARFPVGSEAMELLAEEETP
jgi:hypothetical protein